MENEQAEPRIYEIGYHILPLVPEEKLAVSLGELKAILEKHKAVVISEDYPRNMHLAYKLRKQIAGKYQDFNSAYFGWIKFEASSEAVISISNDFESQNDILRFIVVKTVRENTMAPIKALQQKEGRVREERKKPAEKSPISEEELDKTIEELVVE
ncbi:MAG: 30S ribosomal protein S6 [bacterium]|nr:30S ribosomal protein S6 [bacterium]